MNANVFDVIAQPAQTKRFCGGTQVSTDVVRAVKVAGTFSASSLTTVDEPDAAVHELQGVKPSCKSGSAGKYMDPS